MSTALNIIIALFVGAGVTEAVYLPGGIKPCKADKSLDECVVENAKTVIPILVKGDKKFKIPVLDPLKIIRIAIQQGKDSNNFINMTLTNMEMFGLKGAKMTKSETDLKKRTVKWTFAIKPLKLVSDYEMNGKFLLVPIVGNGKSTITIDEGTFVYSLDYTINKKNGVEYLGLGKHHLDYDVTRVHFNFENLFNGNKQLGDNVNQMLNDNWKEIDKQVGPALAEAIITVLTNVLESLSRLVPYKDLFILE